MRVRKGARRIGTEDGRFAAFVPWAVVLAGLVTMAGLFVTVYVVARGGPGDQDASGALDPAARPPDSAGPSGPASPAFTPAVGLAPRAGTDGGATAAPTPTPPRDDAEGARQVSRPSKTPERTLPPVPLPRAPEVVGDYQVLNSYSDSFIGSVAVSNFSTRDQDWTVRLRFPSNVGRLQAFWTDGAAQPTFSSTGGMYVFTSGSPLGARASVLLKFQFERWGTNSTPTACTTNGISCTGI